MSATMNRDEEHRRIEAMKDLLCKENGIERGRKFDIAWRIAWDYGHSSGLDEVKLYFEDLLDLLKP